MLNIYNISDFSHFSILDFLAAFRKNFISVAIIVLLIVYLMTRSLTNNCLHNSIIASKWKYHVIMLTIGSRRSSLNGYRIYYFRRDRTCMVMSWVCVRSSGSPTLFTCSQGSLDVTIISHAFVKNMNDKLIFY